MPDPDLLWKAQAIAWLREHEDDDALRDEPLEPTCYPITIERLIAALQGDSEPGRVVARETWLRAIAERDEAREACSAATEGPWYWTGIASADDLATMGAGTVIHMTAGQLPAAIATTRERIDLAAALATIRDMNEQLLAQSLQLDILGRLVDAKRSEITELRGKLAAERERNAMIGEHLRAAIGLVSIERPLSRHMPTPDREGQDPIAASSFDARGARCEGSGS